MIRASLFTFFFLSAAFVQVHAQKLWNLHECMVYAVENAPKYKIQEELNQNLRRDQRDAALSLLPSISGNVSGSYYAGRQASQEDNTYVTMTTFNNPYSLSGSMPVFNGFKAVSNLKVARMAKLQGVEESQRIEDEICLSTMQAYFNVLHSFGLVRLAREELLESNQRLKETSLKEELGLKGKADVLQIESEVATRDFTLTQQLNAWEENMLQLKEVMFYPIEQEIMIDTLVRPEMNLLGARESRDSIFKAALDFLPEARKAALEVESKKYLFQTSRLQLLPTLSLSASIGSSYANSSSMNFSKQYEAKLGKNIGLSMSIPLFSGLTRQSNITRARNNMRIAEYQQDQTLQQIEAAIQRAIQEMEGRYKEYVQAFKAVLSEEAAHAVNKRKYEEGLISILELQTSSNLLLTARVRQLNTLLEYQIKRREVAYYKGTPYIEQEF